MGMLLKQDSIDDYSPTSPSLIYGKFTTIASVNVFSFLLWEVSYDV